MGLKKYIIASILLILAVFAYTFSIESGDYKVVVLDYTFLLPIAIWVIIPTLFLVIVSIIHILYYGLKNYFELKSLRKDALLLNTLINKKLLNQNTSEIFKNEEIKDVGEILAQLDIDVSNVNFQTKNNIIATSVKNIFDIKNGNVVSSKILKLENSNTLMIDNIINHIANDEDYALDIVKNNTKYSDKIVKEAFMKVVNTKCITTIKKYINNVPYDKEVLLALFTKDSEQNSEFAMTNDIILSLIKKINLDNDVLIDIAKIYKTSMTPDQIIKLFEDLVTENEKYTTAYLYVLSQYEMIDKMRDILENSANEDFIPFKALVDLKDAGKHTYSLDTLCIK